MRSTNDELASRIEAVTRYRLAGASLADLRQIASESGWQVSERQLRRYVEQSDEVLASHVEKRRDRLLNLSIGRRELLYAKSVELGDYRTASAILKDLDTLLDLYPAAKHQHSGPGGGPIAHDVHHQLTDDERDAIRERLADRLAARLGRGPGIPFGNGDGHRN